jgi:hypothetical protein
MSLPNFLCGIRYESRGFGKTTITIFQPVEPEGDRAIPDHKLRFFWMWLRHPLLSTNASHNLLKLNSSSSSHVSLSDLGTSDVPTRGPDDHCTYECDNNTRFWSVNRKSVTALRACHCQTANSRHWCCAGGRIETLEILFMAIRW